MRALKKTKRTDSGIALLTTILLMLLMSSLLVGFILLVSEGQKLSGTNNDFSRAFYAAEAGMEKLTADLGTLFDKNVAPTQAQLNAIPTNPPSLQGIQFMGWDPKTQAMGSGYRLDYPQDGAGNPVANIATIKSGAYSGMTALITPYTLTVTARTDRGSDVRLQRTTQTVGIPMFQFGVFSETDLSYFPGPNFNFGGRTHTNGNLFLAAGSNLTLADKVDAYKDVIRAVLSNGFSTTTGQYNGTVNITTAPGTTSYRALGYNEGSLVTDLTSSPNLGPPGWTTISTSASYYASNLLTGAGSKGKGTGAKKLDLAIVTLGTGAQPVDIIRRPPPAEDPAVTQERYFAQASLKILLSDNPADLMNLLCIDPTTQPFDLRLLAQPYETLKNSGDPQISALRAKLGKNLVPLAMSGAAQTALNGSYSPNDGYWIKQNSPIIPGFIKIEVQKSPGQPNCGAWKDVTLEVLGLGYVGKNINPQPIGTVAPGTPPSLLNLPPPTASGAIQPSQVKFNSICPEPHPNALIRLERIRDNPSSLPNTPCGLTNTSPDILAQAVTDFWPNALFDTREGALRDVAPGGAYTNMITPGGVMHYVEVDANNVASWMKNSGSFDSVTAQNNFTVYVSDRRGNFNNLGASLPGPWPPLSYTKAETGEYGFEDFANSAANDGCPNNSVDVGEDLDGLGNSVLLTYGQDPGRQMSDTDPKNSSLASPLPSSGPNRVFEGGSPWVGGYGAFTGTTATANTAPLYGTTTTGNNHNAFVQYSTCKVSNNLSGSPIWPGTYIVDANEARQNPTFFFRRAVKLVNGSALSTMACPGTVNGVTINCGLTFASENPVYLQGDFNSNSQAGGWGDQHVATSIAADAVTLLSNNWNDVNSFIGPYSLGNRQAATSWYRVAIIAGKGLSFPRPSYAPQDFGTDGGVHNFLRYIENWGGARLNYRGSLISMYVNHQAIGLFKCCTTVYSPPDRGYNFDVEFLTPALLPPRTPLFRDVNTTGFTQLLLPNQ
jgi:hypothetical protein